MNNDDLKKILRNEFSENDETKFSDINFGSIAKKLAIRPKFPAILRFRYTFVMMMVLVIISSIAFLIKPQSEPVINPENSEFLQYLSSTDTSFIIYKAAKASLDVSGRKNARKLIAIQNESTTYPLRVSYPFDFLRITNPSRFEFNIPSDMDTYVEKHIGTGLIEVIMCHIDFYIEQEDGSLLNSIGDDCIIMKGEMGIIVCLTNGATYEAVNQQYRLEFSTHKTFDSNEVIKDFDKENTKIYVTVDKNGFEETGEPLSIEIDSGLYEPILNSYQEIKASDVYKIGELGQVDLITLEVKVTSINDSEVYFETLEGKNLKMGIIDENTMIVFEDENVASISDILVGSTIIITYPNLFEGYNPSQVFLNEIMIISK